MSKAEKLVETIARMEKPNELAGQWWIDRSNARRTLNEIIDQARMIALQDKEAK